MPGTISSIREDASAVFVSEQAAYTNQYIAGTAATAVSTEHHRNRNNPASFEPTRGSFREQQQRQAEEQPPLPQEGAYVATSAADLTAHAPIAAAEAPATALGFDVSDGLSVMSVFKREIALKAKAQVAADAANAVLAMHEAEAAAAIAKAKATLARPSSGRRVQLLPPPSTAPLSAGRGGRERPSSARSARSAASHSGGDISEDEIEDDINGNYSSGSFENDSPALGGGALDGRQTAISQLEHDGSVNSEIGEKNYSDNFEADSSVSAASVVTEEDLEASGRTEQPTAARNDDSYSDAFEAESSVAALVSGRQTVDESSLAASIVSEVEEVYNESFENDSSLASLGSSNMSSTLGGGDGGRRARGANASRPASAVSRPESVVEETYADDFEPDDSVASQRSLQHGGAAVSTAAAAYEDDDFEADDSLASAETPAPNSAAAPTTLPAGPALLVHPQEQQEQHEQQQEQPQRPSRPSAVYTGHAPAARAGREGGESAPFQPMSYPSQHSPSGQHQQQHGTSNDGRLSPRSLHRKLEAELQYSDAIDHSIRHLDAISRGRDVSAAQHETSVIARLVTSTRDKHNDEQARAEAAHAKEMEAAQLVFAAKAALHHDQSTVAQQKAVFELESLLRGEASNLLEQRATATAAAAAATATAAALAGVGTVGTGGAAADAGAPPSMGTVGYSGLPAGTIVFPPPAVTHAGAELGLAEARNKLLQQHSTRVVAEVTAIENRARLLSEQAKAQDVELKEAARNAAATRPSTQAAVDTSLVANDVGEAYDDDEFESETSASASHESKRRDERRASNNGSPDKMDSIAESIGEEGMNGSFSQSQSQSSSHSHSDSMPEDIGDASGGTAGVTSDVQGGSPSAFRSTSVDGVSEEIASVRTDVSTIMEVRSPGGADTEGSDVGTSIAGDGISSHAASSSDGINTEMPGSHTARTPGPRDATMYGYDDDDDFESDTSHVHVAHGTPEPSSYRPHLGVGGTRKGPHEKGKGKSASKGKKENKKAEEHNRTDVSDPSSTSESSVDVTPAYVRELKGLTKVQDRHERHLGREEGRITNALEELHKAETVGAALTVKATTLGEQKEELKRRMQVQADADARLRTMLVDLHGPDGEPAPANARAASSKKATKPQKTRSTTTATANSKGGRRHQQQGQTAASSRGRSTGTDGGDGDGVDESIVVDSASAVDTTGASGSGSSSIASAVNAQSALSFSRLSPISSKIDDSIEDNFEDDSFEDDDSEDGIADEIGSEIASAQSISDSISEEAMSFVQQQSSASDSIADEVNDATRDDSRKATPSAAGAGDDYDDDDFESSSALSSSSARAAADGGGGDGGEILTSPKTPARGSKPSGGHNVDVGVARAAHVVAGTPSPNNSSNSEESSRYEEKIQKKLGHIKAQQVANTLLERSVKRKNRDAKRLELEYVDAQAKAQNMQLQAERRRAAEKVSYITEQLKQLREGMQTIAAEEQGSAQPLRSASTAMLQLNASNQHRQQQQQQLLPDDLSIISSYSDGLTRKSPASPTDGGGGDSYGVDLHESTFQFEGRVGSESRDGTPLITPAPDTPPVTPFALDANSPRVLPSTNSPFRVHIPSRSSPAAASPAGAGVVAAAGAQKHGMSPLRLDGDNAAELHAHAQAQALARVLAVAGEEDGSDGTPNAKKSLSFNDGDFDNSSLENGRMPQSSSTPSAADVDAITQALLADLLNDPALAGIMQGSAFAARTNIGGGDLAAAADDDGHEVITPLAGQRAPTATSSTSTSPASAPPPLALVLPASVADNTATGVSSPPRTQLMKSGGSGSGSGAGSNTMDGSARSPTPRSPELTTANERWVHAPTSPVDEAVNADGEPVRALHPPGGLSLPDPAAGGPPHSIIHSLSLPETETDGERTAQTDEASVLAFAGHVVELFIELGCSKRVLPLSWEEHGGSLTAPGVHQDQRMHNHLVFDCVNEILEEQYKYERSGSGVTVDRPEWMKPDKNFSRYRRPPSAAHVGEIVANKLKTYASFQEQSERAIIEAVLAWQVGEGEAEWIDYDQDEIVVCMKAADLLTADMLDEAIESMAAAHARSRSSRA